MKNKVFNSKNAIIAASFMLAGYLLLVLTVTNSAQSKLDESQHQALHQKVEYVSELLSEHLLQAQQTLSTAANDKTITTFFANKSSGMSMTYGLSASLFHVQKKMENFINPVDAYQSPHFSRVTLTALDGEIFADTQGASTSIDLNIDNEGMNDLIRMEQDQGKITIKFFKTIYFHDLPIAYLIAELDKKNVHALIKRAKEDPNALRVELRQNNNHLLLADSLITPLPRKSQHDHTRQNSLFYSEQVIKGTPMLIRSWFEINPLQDFFTSKIFVLAISLLGFPVFFGLYYLVQTERKNTRLKAEKSSLSEHNQRLKVEVDMRKLSEKKLAYQATHDALTGLPNRSYSIEKLSQAIEQAMHSNNKLLVMYIDLDNFKQINDSLGHAAGDIILQKTSQRLNNAVRASDVVARLSGDEFMLIIPQLSDKKQAMNLAKKILLLFGEPFETQEGQPFHASASIGLSLFPEDGHDPATLLKCADMALYRVKEQGRNDFSFYEPSMNNEVNRKVAIKRRLRVAIAEGTLEMYYQPLIDLNSHRITGVEALMRWTDAELGFVSPVEFIDVAEKNGLINQLGSFALDQAVSQVAKWQAISPLQVAVNFSSVQFKDCPKLLNEIQQVLLTTGLPANKLDIEVTESLLINQEDELIRMLQSLRHMGIQLSIDDFGTGYSALSYLQKFSFTKLKIDRAFVMNLSTNTADQALVTAIVAMAKALNLKVVAEGIEEQSQAHFLNKLNCEYGQGYLYSKPVPAHQLEEMLKAQVSLPKQNQLKLVAD